MAWGRCSPTPPRRRFPLARSRLSRLRRRESARHGPFIEKRSGWNVGENIREKTLAQSQANVSHSCFAVLHAFVSFGSFGGQRFRADPVQHRSRVGLRGRESALSRKEDSVRHVPGSPVCRTRGRPDCCRDRVGRDESGFMVGRPELCALRMGLQFSGCSERDVCSGGPR